MASSTYAQYYFDLRSLAEDNSLSFPNEYEALTKERAKQLEVGHLVHVFVLSAIYHHIVLTFQDTDCHFSETIFAESH